MKRNVDWLKPIQILSPAALALLNPRVREELSHICWPLFWPFLVAIAALTVMGWMAWRNLTSPGEEDDETQP